MKQDSQNKRERVAPLRTWAKHYAKLHSMTLTAEQAEYEVRLVDKYTTSFYTEFGHHEHYNAADVLHWLGY